MKYELMRAYDCKISNSFVLDLYNMHYNKGVELHYYKGGNKAEYISREATIEQITSLCELREIVCSANDEFLRGLKKALITVKSNELVPSADVQPVKRGRWIWKERHRNSYQIVKGIDECGKEGSLQIHEEYKEQINYCSECGKQGHEIFLNFCPNCGARME